MTGNAQNRRSTPKPGFRAVQVWYTKADAKDALLSAAVGAGAVWPYAAPVAKAIWTCISISDPAGELQTVKGEPVADVELRDFENVPLGEDIQDYLKREIRPHVPEAWTPPGRSPASPAVPRRRDQPAP
jgi:type I restriction enzyme M protein